ncbi:MAG: sensor histidine kinase [Bdellovibrionota bacterium]
MAKDPPPRFSLAQRLGARPLRYFHYLGIVFAVLMVWEVRRSTNEADQTLSRSVYQQQNLRNILWINLLIHRSTGMALTGKQVSDPAYFERARTVADSMESRVNGENNDMMKNLSATDLKSIQRNIDDYKSGLDSFLDKKQNANQFTSVVDRVGADLNRIESEEWYRLNEQNEKLLQDEKRDHATLMILLGMFAAYLALLGWILNRKEKAEAALVDAEAKMLNSAKISALGEMAGGVAHEINNPLAVISLLTEQIREMLEEKKEENALPIEMLEKSQKTIIRISQIVQGLRTFSRDGSKDNYAPVTVQEFLSSTLSLCQEKFRHRGISVTVNIQPPGLAVLCQQVQISQVLLNLLNNACDAIEQLPEKWIKISAEKCATGVLLSVTDSGKGISKEIEEKIFNPFFTTKEIGKGTGLGLSISKGIIHAHKGKISVDRTCPNTCFLITLPAGSIPPGSKTGENQVA